MVGEQTYQPPLPIFPEEVRYLSLDLRSPEEDGKPYEPNLIGVPIQQIEEYTDENLRRVFNRQLYEQRTMARRITVPLVTVDGRLSHTLSVGPVVIPTDRQPESNCWTGADVPFEIFEAQTVPLKSPALWLGGLARKIC